MIRKQQQDKKKRQFHKKIYYAFLEKEKGSLDETDRQEIRVRYTARRDLMFKKYLVGKYHLITLKNA